MKLRLNKNSIRLRLTKGELRELAETGSVEENVDFGPELGGNFAYRLHVNPSETHIYSTFQERTITVGIPTHLADEWITTDRIGLESEQDNGDGNVLRILLEKDFACLHTRKGEEETDAFPRPPSDLNG